MLRRFALLQFPLVYLPLCVYGLGVYGSDFDVLAGRVFVAFAILLVILERFAARALERLAGGKFEVGLSLFATLAAGWAYKPLHLGYWNEHSTEQALGVCALGLFSWSAARMACVPRSGEASSRRAVAAALLMVGSVWSSAWLYPLLPLLVLGVLLAVHAAVGVRKPGESISDAPPELRGDVGFERLAALCLGVDAFLVVWDYQWINDFAPQLFALFAAAGLAFYLGRTWSRWCFAAGVLNFLCAVLVRSWVLHPLHAVGAGLALGALLLRWLADTQASGSPRRASLGGFSFFWVLGLVLGLGLYQNLAHAGWRALLLVPMLALAWRARRRTETR